MKRTSLFLIPFMVLTIFPSLSNGKEVPKIAVWDLVPREVKSSYAQGLTSIVVSEIAKLKMFEVYSQENVRTLAGWTAERMKLGCTETQCLIALGQMDIAKLISGSVDKIGNRYVVSLNLFDTGNAKAENAVSELGGSENELIDLVQLAVGKLLFHYKYTDQKTGKNISSAEPLTETELEEAFGKLAEKERKTDITSEGMKPFRDLLTGMEFVFIHGGCFEMGDSFGDGNTDEKPVHEVCVSDFYLGKYAVTQGQWRAVMGNNPSYLDECGNDCPVESISWNDAQEFILKLTQRAGKRFRLPTEAEWEYAARNGGKREKWAGTSKESELGEYAWYSNNSGSKTHPVGQKRANGLGLHDMSGNVWEWCQDWYGWDYYQGSANNPQGPSSGDRRVLRGGSWLTGAKNVRTALRTGLDPRVGFANYGLRLVLPSR